MEAGGSLSIAVTSSPAEGMLGRRGYGMKMDYSHVGSAGNMLLVYGAAGNADVSAYNYVSMWVKGSVGGEKVKFGLKQTSGGVESQVYINEFLASGITTGWQKVVIPLTAFGALTIINRLEEYGVKVEKIVNCGGIDEKNPMVIEIY